MENGTALPGGIVLADPILIAASVNKMNPNPTKSGQRPTEISVFDGPPAPEVIMILKSSPHVV